MIATDYTPAPIAHELGRWRVFTLVLLATTLVLAALACSSARAQGPWFQLASETAPTSLQPGGEGELVVKAVNLGDQAIDGKDTPVVIGNVLPPGVTVKAVAGSTSNESQVECVLSTLQCTFHGVLYPYEQLVVTLEVKDEQMSSAGLNDQASVGGGGAVTTSASLPIPVAPKAPTGYGIEHFDLQPYNEDGSPDRQAGSQPFELTTTLSLAQTREPRLPVELPKDLQFQLPPGLLGNPTSVEQCTMVNFFAFVEETNLCSPSSVIGVATVTADEPLNLKVFTSTVPVFNLVPDRGEPAKLGFEVGGVLPIVVNTSVRTGRDYGVVASVEDATQTAGLLSSQVTLWGVPGDPSHNSSRGWECVAGSYYVKVGEVAKPCPVDPQLEQRPFLLTPTSCASDPSFQPTIFSMQTDSWAHPGVFLGAEYAWMTASGEPLGFDGCDSLPFEPSLAVTPEEHVAATPSGLDVTVRVPQQSTLKAGGLAEADVRDTTVTLPAGVELSPSAANGLEGCSEGQIGFEGLDATTQTDLFSDQEAACPDGSKVGTVRIKTPLLDHELEGSVYLASPAPNGEGGRNPFDSLVALYLVAKDPISGVLVKLAGEGHVDEGSLRISTTFANTPQVPFEELRLHLFGGPRASVSTPSTCGTYATEAAFTPWSQPNAVNVLSAADEFAITAGVAGGGCPASVPFAPGFKAESTATQAGAYTGFFLELTRPDGDQALSGLSLHLPAGVAAMLSHVTLCGEAAAITATCPADSEVGRAVAIAGLGSEPFVQEGGRAFITGPYGGAPFGLEVVTPAKAGPFDLGYVTIRSKLYIDEHNATVTIVSDPLPTQIRGIPLQLKRVIVEVTRGEFEFNPTSCEAMQITGTIRGDQGTSQDVSQSFKVAGCEKLPFHPSFAASVTGKNSKANGAGLTVRVGSAFGQANIGKAKVILPAALPARLTTLQKACTEATFNSNPASCPEGSVVGTATVHTPVLDNPLTGPAYLVSHGNAAFPDLEFVLQGEGIKLILDGQTAIHKGITSSSFETVPDAPVDSFETNLSQGPHSALTTNLPAKANFSLCGHRLTMPTTLVGQNGALAEQQTTIAVQGCGAVKSSRAKRLGRAQELALALRQCRKRYGHSRRKRLLCERRARIRYAAHKKAKRSAKHPTGNHHTAG